MKKSNEVSKIRNYFSSLKIERISTVFCIPHVEFNNKYVVKYSSSFTYSKKLYYIRSHGLDFLITPYSLFIENRGKRIGIYTIGSGLHQGKLIDVILIELFDTYHNLKRVQMGVFSFFKENTLAEDILNSIKSKHYRLSLSISIALI